MALRRKQVHIPRITGQALDPADVADGLIGIAQELEATAKRLKQSAKEVRAGHFLPDFAYSFGRNARFQVLQVIERELPEAWDREVHKAAQKRAGIA